MACEKTGKCIVADCQGGLDENEERKACTVLGRGIFLSLQIVGSLDKCASDNDAANFLSQIFETRRPFSIAVSRFFQIVRCNNLLRDFRDSQDAVERIIPDSKYVTALFKNYGLIFKKITLKDI